MRAHWGIENRHRQDQAAPLTQARGVGWQCLGVKVRDAVVMTIERVLPRAARLSIPVAC